MGDLARGLLQLVAYESALTSHVPRAGFGSVDGEGEADPGRHVEAFEGEGEFADGVVVESFGASAMATDVVGPSECGTRGFGWRVRR
jgi:hypothetical protein